MSGSYNNYSCFPHFNSRPFVDPLRNPYDPEFRAPLNFPPRPQGSPYGYSPRHSPQNQNFRQKRPYPQLEDSLVARTLPCGRNSFGSTPPSNTPNSFSPFNSGSSSGFSNRSSFTPRNSFHNRQHNRYSFNDSNPGGSSNIHDYYNPSMFCDPWAGLKPVRAKPKQVSNL